MKTLYNLTYDEEFYVSTLHPDRLPEDDFSLIEIEYNDETVRSIKGLYCYDGKQESLVLTDLEIMGYLKNLKDFECEIEFHQISFPFCFCTCVHPMPLYPQVQ